jgi:hypothetical protein
MSEKRLLHSPTCEECSETDEDAHLVYEGSSKVALVVSVALFAAAFAQLSVCADQHVCISEGTCVCPETHNLPSCAFKTALTAAYSRMLLGTQHNFSRDSRERRIELERGVCQFGLHEDIDVNDNVVCRRKRFYPNAMNLDIVGAADEPSPHRRWCGKWIDSGASTIFGADRWGWFDEALVERSVERAITARGATTLGIDAISKFRSACRSMLSASATSPATISAHEHLRQKMDAAMDANGAAGTNGSVAAVAVLAAHYCNAPLGIEVLLFTGPQGDAVLPHVFAGQLEAPSVLDGAMYAVGASTRERGDAAEFSRRATALAGADQQGVSKIDSARLFAEALKGSWLESSSYPTVDEGGSWNWNMRGFLLAQEELGATKARAYLSGAAAVCATMVRTVASSPERVAVGADGDGDAPRGNRAALTRLSAAQGDRFSAATPETARRASRVGISALAAAATATRIQAFGSRTEVRLTCLRAASAMFPNAIESATFETLVTPKLYDRLERATVTIRAAVVHALGSELIGSLFSQKGARDAAIKHVETMGVTIPGARTGTWAGRARAFRHASDTSSDDGALVLALKQVNALFLDNAAMAVNGEGVREMNSLFLAAERNAYFFPAGRSEHKVSALMPGLMSPPFADERMDNESLLARVGFVIAHELGHVTFNQSEWNGTRADELLHAYPASERLEGIADLVAAAALAHTDVFSNDQLCAHISQLWCGRKGSLRDLVPKSARSHPPMNDRGNRICEFLNDHFYNHTH